MTKARASRRVWDRYAIRAAVHRGGKTLEALSEENGLPVSSCSVALLRPHTAGERAIATFLDVPLWVLWPSRHDAPAGSKPESARPASPIGGGA